MKLSLNVFLSLIIQAKRSGKGLVGNGKLYVRLMGIIVDAEKYKNKEETVLGCFGNDAAKNEAYRKLDKFLSRFIKNGKSYPYELFNFSKFENEFSMNYKVYLMEMKRFFNDILAPEKCVSLVNELLEIMRDDSDFSEIIYGNRKVKKAEFLGTFTHPKQICIEAFLLGILHYVHKNICLENTENLKIKEPFQPVGFRLVSWTNDKSLTIDIEITPMDFIEENSGNYENIHAYVNEFDFIVQYCLGFVAYEMFRPDICRIYADFSISKGDIFEAVNRAFDVFIYNEKIYYSYNHQENYNEKYLLEYKKNADLIEIILSSGFMKICKNDPDKICFVAEIYRNYFAARYILNLVEAFIESYKMSISDEQKKAYYSLKLDSEWFVYDKENMYRILGIICGDSRNIPDKNYGEFWYVQTVLDKLLDIYRGFGVEYDEFFISENVMNTMNYARNGIVCGVNFSGLPLPENVHDIQFQCDDFYCNFSNCHVYNIDVFDKKTVPKNIGDCTVLSEKETDISGKSNFKGCIFRNAFFHNSDYRNSLKIMGAVVD